MTLYDLTDAQVAAIQAALTFVSYKTFAQKDPQTFSEHEVANRTRDALEAIKRPVDADAVVTTHYRALLPNGSLWAESRDMDDVLLQAQYAPEPVTLEAQEVWELEQPWRPLTPPAAALEKAQETAAMIERVQQAWTEES